MDGNKISGDPQNYEAVKNKGVNESDPFMTANLALEKNRSEKIAPVEFF